MTSKNELAWIIKGGIAGAFLVAGASLVLILLVGGNGPALPFVGHFLENWAKKWTLEGTYSVFILAGGVGFILGSIAGRQHLHVVQEWSALVSAFGILLVFGLWLFYTYANRVEFPREMKLADCTNSTVRVRLKVPRGRNYHLVLAPSGVELVKVGKLGPSYEFSGHVRISREASSIADFSIGSDRARPNEFTHEGIPFGFTLTGDSQNTNRPPLSSFIQAQGDYDIEITFDQPPPPASSVWLHWLQARKDRDR